MMQIKTKYHGEIEINNEKILNFSKGIPGFIEEKEFILLPFGDDTPFIIMQSTKTTALAFVLIEPFTYFKEYEFQIPDHVLEQLNIKEEKEVLVFAIVTVKEPFEKSTVNLQAPLVINSNKNEGQQLVLNDHRFQTRHHLFEQASSVGQEG